MRRRCDSFCHGSELLCFFPGRKHLGMQFFLEFLVLFLGPMALCDQVLLETFKRIAEWKGSPFILRAVF